MTRLPFMLLAAGALLFPLTVLAEDDDRVDEQISETIRRADPERIAAVIQRLQDFGTRNSCSTNAPSGRGVNAARDWLVEQYGKIPRLQVQVDRFVHPSCPNAPTFNVFAWLPGKRNPERLVVIGGHYDSRTINVFDTTSDAPGANDAGAQTSVVLEVARLLAGSGEEEGDDDGPNYDNTLVFASFSGEEQGLIGSASFAAKLTTQIFPGASVIAMLNNDIPGGDNTVNSPAQLRQFRLYSPGTPRERTRGAADGTTDNTSPSRGLMRYIGTWGAAYVPGMQMVPKLREDRPGRGSDQSSFIRLGIPAVRFMETVECSPSPPDNSTPYPPPGYPANCLDFTTAHQHAPTDLAVFTTPSYAARIAQVMASVMASLALAPGAPQNIQVSGDSVQGATVSWSAPAFGRVHEYVIAARSSDANLYGQQVRAGKRETSRFVTASDLGVPEGDSFFVSVAAVDERNHESLFAYPEYRCSPSGCVVPPGATNITASK